MKVKINQPVEVEVALLKVHVFCRDSFSMRVIDTNGNELVDYDGYVPDFIPGDYGDYVALDIDPRTGVIKNWPTQEKIAKGIQELIAEKDED